MERIFPVLIGISSLLALAGVAPANQNIVGREVDYTAGGVVMKGYVAYDENISGKRPGVLVVPEWWGIGDYARRRARMLAELGYAALAVDMYGGGKQAANPEEAAKFSSGIANNLDLEKGRFTAATELLKNQPTVDAGHIAAIGYCFGGGVVLNMALQGVDLRGVVSFHGILPAGKPPRPGAAKAKILVLQGTGDKFVAHEQVEAFRKEMENAGVDFRIILYPGASHSFTNPEADEYAKKFNLPISYDAEADKQSWDELKEFLHRIFLK
jgi:dienelactone hydrolase